MFSNCWLVGVVGLLCVRISVRDGWSGFEIASENVVFSICYRN